MPSDDRAEYGDDTDRLHGEWNDTGTRRWCADCGVWVRLEDWHDHKRELAKAVTDGGCSIAREHLLGATVWAYAGGAARVRPWDSREDYPRFRRCVNS